MRLCGREVCNALFRIQIYKFEEFYFFKWVTFFRKT